MIQPTPMSGRLIHALLACSPENTLPLVSIDSSSAFKYCLMPTCAAGALASSAAAVTGATVGAARASGSAVASRLLACAIGTTLPLVRCGSRLGFIPSVLARRPQCRSGTIQKRCTGGHSRYHDYLVRSSLCDAVLTHNVSQLAMPCICARRQWACTFSDTGQNLMPRLT